jgi:transcriptional repressor NrdR
MTARRIGRVVGGRPLFPFAHSKELCVRCPFCKHDETKVIDSRNSQDFSIRRRRECLSCERRFTTYERIEESPIRVIKKDGTRVPFDREKIRSGVEKACYKRPVSPEQVDRLVGDVEAAIYEDGEREVSSRRIGELVFNALRDLDKVAFVRFASVYREFQDVHDFVDELKPILDRNRRDSSH